MGISNRRAGNRWKAWGCGVAILGIALIGAAAGAATPTVPGAPTITSVTAGHRSVKVTFTKPADNGGAKIVDYRVKCTSSNGGAKGSRGTSKSPVVVAGLTAAKTYTCTVTARNKMGLGPASAASDPVVTLGH